MGQLSGPTDPTSDVGWHTHETRKGFFTDTSICIGCKACEVACKEWNSNPRDGDLELTGMSYDNTVALGASTWRHVAFIEQSADRIAEARESGRALVGLGMPSMPLPPAEPHSPPPSLPADPHSLPPAEPAPSAARRRVEATPPPPPPAEPAPSAARRRVEATPPPPLPAEPAPSAARRRVEATPPPPLPAEPAPSAARRRVEATPPPPLPAEPAPSAARRRVEATPPPPLPAEPAPSAARRPVEATPPDTPEFRWLMSSDVCKHCTHAGCLDVCPTGALFRTEFGTVVIQDDVCNGCGTCVAGCPFGVVERRADGTAAPTTRSGERKGEQPEVPKRGVAQKCTLCYDRLLDDETPACAQTCPTTSIKYGDHDDLVADAHRRVAQLHEQGMTEARLYGANPNDGVGGTGSVFLLLDEPEVYGLPPDPRVCTADLPSMYKRAGVAAVGMLAAAAVSFLRGGR